MDSTGVPEPDLEGGATKAPGPRRLFYDGAFAPGGGRPGLQGFGPTLQKGRGTRKSELQIPRAEMLALVMTAGGRLCAICGQLSGAQTAHPLVCS